MPGQTVALAPHGTAEHAAGEAQQGQRHGEYASNHVHHRVSELVQTPINSDVFE